MRDIKQMQLRGGITVAHLVKEMTECGVLGAGKIGKAAKLTAKMFTNPDYTVFLTLAGALVPGGLRQIITSLIEEEYIDVMVSTGANMVHDIIEALGHRHKVGTFKAQDEQLKLKSIGRIGDIYIEHKAFEDMEKWLHNLFDQLPKPKKQAISPSSLLMEIGRKIEDKNSILAAAARRDVPIICPGLPDSIAGFQLWTYAQDKDLILDPLEDTTKLLDKVYEAKKSGIIILGGGWPKHFALFANSFRQGVDVAVQITMDRPEPGGLSGASLEEAVSWNKVKAAENSVTVICDATIAFPIIIASALDHDRIDEIYNLKRTNLN